MRILSAVLFATSLSGAAIILASVNMLSNSDAVLETLKSEATKNALLIGDVHHIFLLKQFWRDLPIHLSAFHLGRCFDWTAILLSGSLSTAVVTILRSQWNARWLAVGIVILSLWFIPYFAGRIALRDNLDLERVGRWTSTMLLSVLYLAIGCALCAAFEFRTSRGKMGGLGSRPLG